MKNIFLIVLISASAYSSTDCPTEDNPAVSSVTSVMIPNCRVPANVVEEIESSKFAQDNLPAGQSLPEASGPICQTCRRDFNARVPAGIDIKAKKKQAFFNVAYRELEKSLTNIVTDVVGLRKTYSLTASYGKSISACNTNSIEEALNRCSSSFLNEFKSKGLQGRIANEIASLISSPQNGQPGILVRDESLNSCPISDEIVQNLKPRLFETILTSDLVSKINSIQATSPLELQQKLSSKFEGGREYALLYSHPVLRELLKEPSKFFSTFRSLSNSSNNEALRNTFRAKIYSEDMGKYVDSKNAEKCGAAIRAFTGSICSQNLKDGNVSLSPFSNYEKYQNGEDIVSSTPMSDNDLLENSLMLQFCEQPSTQNVSLKNTLQQMNSWMIDDDRKATLPDFVSTKYSRDYGETKASICGYLASGTCNISDGEQCALFELYKQTTDQRTPAGRLAISSDSSVNRVLGSLIGSGTIEPRTREVLVSAGILPNAQGQLAQQPAIPERHPDYLTNVANGTINPNTGAPTTPTTQTAARTPTRNGSQNQNFQGSQPGSAAVEPQTSADAANPNELRDFEDSLRDRLRRAEAQNAANTAATTATRTTSVPRSPSRSDTSGRSPQTTQPTTTSGFVPSADVPAPSIGPSSPSTTTAPSVSSANLGNDNSRQTRAQRQANAALADMAGARGVNPTTTAPVAGRGPASVDGATVSPNGVVSLTINGDVRANIEKVLDSQNIVSLIQRQQPFQFQLNNSLFDVRYTNGAYSVVYRSGDASVGPSVATDLQRVFNSSLSARTSKLTDLQNTVRN